MDEIKITLNNAAKPQKDDGLFIIIKREVGKEVVYASHAPMIHLTKKEAQKEAERLALLAPSYEFLVMQAISLSKTTKVETTPFKVTP